MITTSLSASKLVSILVRNDPLAENEGYYDMDVKVCVYIQKWGEIVC